MKKSMQLSSSEFEVMQAIWKADSPATVAQLQQVFAERKWKTQTMATFLTRLADKGVVVIEKKTKGNLYSAAITEQEYHHRLAQGLLKTMYDGSLFGFLSALYCDGKIEPQDMDQLKKWFDEVSSND